MATRAVEEAPGEAAAKPRQRTGRHSGRLLLRMPAGLHEELARASDRNGVSLNQFITSVLAGAVGWGRDDAAGTTIRGRSRWLIVLLAANLLLVAAAAVSAIVFLVAAWMN